MNRRLGPSVSGTDEPALIERAREGDQAALDQLLRQHYDRVYAVCRRMTGNDADASDATQEALISIVRGLGRYDGRAAFSTWAYRIASNASVDELRRRRRRPDPGLPEREPAGRGEPSLAQSVADRLTLDEALQALTTEYREPLVLRDVAGLDYAQIAEQLGIPPGTVRSRIARARGQLARRLGGERVAGNQLGTDERPTA